MSDPIVLAPSSGRQGQLAAGMVAAGGSTLLPASFRRLLPEQPAADDPVTLGDIEAYRYEGLRPEGLDGPVTLYTAPTSGGVATIACTAQGQGHGAARGLRGRGDDAHVVRREGVPARPQRGLRQVARRGIRRAWLGAKVRTRPRFAGLTTQAAQAQAATRLEKDYATAARTLARAEVSPADQEANARIVASLRGIEGAYRRTASAARAGDSGAYAAAGDDVRSGGRRLERALGSLEELGYAPS